MLSAGEHLRTDVKFRPAFTAIDSGLVESRCLKGCESEESESTFPSLYTAGESMNCV